MWNQNQYSVVPWYNSDEWHTVYRNIYSENQNKKDAVEMLLIWKARCPALPSGIESTLSLLQVNIQDEKSSNDITNDQILRLAYSSALMRYVNFMLDTETARGTSLYNAAKTAGVPDWIVDLRHDTAHNNNLPSLALLRNACMLSLEWLRENYWENHKKIIGDYITGQQNPVSCDENKIAALIHLCSCLSICSHSKIKKLVDITDASMQESIVNDARDLFGGVVDFSKLKTVSIAHLINIMNINTKKLLQNDSVPFVIKALLGDESLFFSLELVEYLSRNDFNNKYKLSRSYVKCFEVLLSFLHTNEIISDFVSALISTTQNEDYCSKKKLLAALWISEILAALKKSAQFVERANKMNSQGGVSAKKKDLKVLYHHWFPNEKLDGLILDLQKPVPSKFTNINMIQPIISSYNAYLTYFIKDILDLVQPHLPKQVSDKICKLAKLISSPENFPIQPSERIYTIEDLKSEKHIDVNLNVSLDNNIDTSETHIEDETICGIWKLAAKHNWGSCPIGKLPIEHDVPDVEME